MAFFSCSSFSKWIYDPLGVACDVRGATAVDVGVVWFALVVAVVGRADFRGVVADSECNKVSVSNGVTCVESGDTGVVDEHAWLRWSLYRQIGFNGSPADRAS